MSECRDTIFHKFIHGVACDFYKPNINAARAVTEHTVPHSHSQCAICVERGYVTTSTSTANSGVAVTVTGATSLDFAAHRPTPVVPQSHPWAGTPELVLGEVYGARAWFTDYLGRLRPLHTRSSQVIWHPGVNEAKCYLPYTRGGEEHTDDGNCKCGFYAWTDYKTAATECDPEKIWNPSRVGNTLSRVKAIEATQVGIVAATGTVTQATKGFRATKARVHALLKPPPHVELLYPDAKVYTGTQDQMFADFDIKPPPPRTPESDPDFWSVP